MDKTPTEWMIEPLRRYAQFSGRSRRAEFWWFTLFGLIVALIAFLLDSLLGLRPARGGTGLIGGLCSLALCIPQLAVQFRRLHDIGRTAWWLVGPAVLGMIIGVAVVGMARGGGSAGSGIMLIVIGIAAIAYSVWMIVWFATRGTAGSNRFGPDPLALD